MKSIILEAKTMTKNSNLPLLISLQPLTCLNITFALRTRMTHDSVEAFPDISTQISIITFRSASLIISEPSPLFVGLKFAFKIIVPLVTICNTRCTNKNFALSPNSAFMYFAYFPQCTTTGMLISP